MLVTVRLARLFLQALLLKQLHHSDVVNAVINKKLKFKADKMTNEEQFFKELLTVTKVAFHNSPVFKEQQKLGKQWNYSICGTPIQLGKGILLGINWGVSGDHVEQTKMPDGKDIPSYNFIQRSKPFLEKYLSLDFDVINFNYTNLCFFRTPDEIFLRPMDYKNSLPLFQQFVQFINPKWIFSLGNNNCKILLQLGQLANVKEFYDNDKKHKALSAELWGHNFFSVPHPNARVKTKSRNEIWESIGEEIIKTNLAQRTPI